MLVLTSKTSTSEASEADSLTNDINAIKKTLNEQSETLSELGDRVSAKRVLKLSDGSTVTQSDGSKHTPTDQRDGDDLAPHLRLSPKRRIAIVTLNTEAVVQKSGEAV